ncbi:Stp1/IreP family PP2C-type Ser/Thr phosphatase [bacterium]|nr:Stp1/IreP family PP2C-type Ser/Thr phosphatase [bacterium]
MLLRMASQTDVGKKRSLNEDKMGKYVQENLYLVCDGMGGQSAGDIASAVAVETIINYIKLIKNGNFLSLRPELKKSALSLKACNLVEAIRLANRRIFRLAVKYPYLRGMGTTVVAVVLDGNDICVAHVGDSRVYRMRKGKIKRLTQDHSWVNELLQDKEINEEEARSFRQKNVITRALGTKGMVKVDIRIEPVFSDDLFILCSDGLTAVVEDEEICSAVMNAKGDINLACENLINLANEKGGPDNISVEILLIKNDNKKGIIDRKNNPLESIITISEEENTVLQLEDELLAKMYSESDDEKIGILVSNKKVWQNPLFFSGMVLFSSMLMVFLVLIYKGSGKKEEVEKVSFTTEEEVISGKVKIETVPPGAIVFVDGRKSIKRTPAELTLPERKERPYKIGLKRIDYKERVVSVFVVANDEIKICETLVPQAQINFVLGFEKELPQGSKIYIDDQRVDLDINQLCVIQTKDLAVGMHSIKIKKGNEVLWRESFSLALDEVKSIVIE